MGKTTKSGTAFDAKRFTGWRLNPEDVVIIGLDTDDGPEHPAWDPRIKLPIKERFVLQLMAEGVVTPIQVYKETGNGPPIVAEGRQRIRHSRIANERLIARGDDPITVPAVLAKGSDERITRVGMFTNAHRQDDDVLTKAANAERLGQRNGNDDAATALTLNVSESTIRNWRKLMELTPDVRKAVNSGVLSANAASQLHGMTKDEQLEALKDVTSGPAFGNGKARPATASQVNGSKGPKRPGKKAMQTRLDELQENFNTDRKNLKSDQKAYARGMIEALKYGLGQVEDVSDIGAK